APPRTWKPRRTATTRCRPWPRSRPERTAPLGPGRAQRTARLNYLGARLAIGGHLRGSAADVDTRPPHSGRRRDNHWEAHRSHLRVGCSAVRLGSPCQSQGSSSLRTAMYDRRILIEQTDPELFAAIQAENARQEHHIEL